MARWQTGGRERLATAAMELFADRGFEATTVAEIAARADLTERTFYRHFADKREVLFVGQDQFESMFVEALDRVGPTADPEPMALVAAALSGANSMFTEERRPWSRMRHGVLAANPELLERELFKMSALGASLTSAFTERGLDPTTAALAADTCVSIFRRAFAMWIDAAEDRPFADLAAVVLARFTTLAAPSPRPEQK